MAELKFIKLSLDMFDNRKIKQIEKMPDGYQVLIVWIKLIILSGKVNESGFLYLTSEIPYTEETLATEFGQSLTVIKLALDTFIGLGMIDVIDDVLHLTNWEEYQNQDTLQLYRQKARERKQRQREKAKAVLAMSRKEEKESTKEKEETIYINNIKNCRSKNEKRDMSHVVSRDCHVTCIEQNQIAPAVFNDSISEIGKEAFDYWQQNLGLPSPLLAAKIQDLAEEIGLVDFKRAIELAIERNRRNFAYIKATAQGIHENGEFKKEKGGKSGSGSDSEFVTRKMLESGNVF